MGAACSSTPPGEKLHVHREHGMVVIEIISAENLPKMDIASHSDPFATVQFTTVDDKPIMDKVHRTQVRTDDHNPVWHNYLTFAFTPEDTDKLVVTLYDEDITSPDAIGSVDVSFDDLKAEQDGISRPLTMITSKRSDDGESAVRFRLVSVTPRSEFTNITKTVFLIRHGESKWNDAQDKNKVKDMVKQTDHELNAKGIDQARDFNAKWRKIYLADMEVQIPENTKEPSPPLICCGNGPTPIPNIDPGTIEVKELTPTETLERKFFHAETTIMASPFTRAVETSLLALEGHPAVKSGGIQLQRNLRETKNIGSMDTVGRWQGDDIIEEVTRELTDENVEVEGVTTFDGTMVNVDAYDATGQWWTPVHLSETRAEVLERQRVFLRTLRWHSSDVFILVGHSHFFKELCRNFISEKFKKEDRNFTGKLSRTKLDNAACLCIEITWELSPDMHNLLPDMHVHHLNDDPKIESAELMFGSEFCKAKK